MVKDEIEKDEIEKDKIETERFLAYFRKLYDNDDNIEIRYEYYRIV